MQHPGQALCNMDTRAFEAAHLHHQGPVDIKRGVVSPLLPPKVHCQLLSLSNNQEEVVVLTPAGQVLYFLQVGLFTVICDQAHHSCVISKLDDGVGVECGYTVVCVQGIQQNLRLEGTMVLNAEL